MSTPNGASNGRAKNKKKNKPAGAPRSPLGDLALPGEVQRRIDSGDLADPMWYVGRIGPSVEDVLDATEGEIAEYRKLANGNGNGNGKLASRRKRPA
jgi:hypothetical protein